jgi:hypothetical protein
MVLTYPRTPQGGGNQFAHSHSDQTEIHIYLVPKIPKPFDLLGFSRQKADRFSGSLFPLCLRASLSSSADSYRMDSANCFFGHFVPSQAKPLPQRALKVTSYTK